MEEEQEIENLESKPAPKKKARKKAAKKKAAKKKTTKKKVEPVVENTPEPKPEQRTLLFSSDDDKPEPTPEPVEKEPVATEENSSDNEPQKQQDSQGNKPNHNNKNQNRHRNQHNRNKKQNHNNNNNNNKKNRFQNKKKKKGKSNLHFFESEKEAGFDPGNLAEEEFLSNIEALNNHIQSLELSDDVFELAEVYHLPVPQLLDVAFEKNIEFDGSPGRNDILLKLLQHAFEKKVSVEAEGVLEITEDGYGVLVFEYDSYRQKRHSIYIPQILIKHFGLLPGHVLKVKVLPAQNTEDCSFAYEILTVMGVEPSEITSRVPFTELIPYYPLNRIIMETPGEVQWDATALRIVDLISPIGFGQRALVVAPPRTGKTVLLQAIAHSIQKNNPDSHLIVLLIDERPEEVTDFKRQIDGEVISSTFDESAESHVHAAEMVIEKTRRMVEAGQHVVVLLDSITRLARAYNAFLPNSGKILSGGVEANALQRPKRFFGSARNIEGGGSLTIIATALIETGSKMDEVIFEEFKGTGNMELHLDRALSEKRVYPALNMEKSGTRKEELLYHPDELKQIYSLRRAMKGVPSVDAMESLIQRVKKTRNNAEFLMTLNR